MRIEAQSLLHSRHSSAHISRDQRLGRRSPNESQLQEGVNLRDGRGMHFCAREREIPVPIKRLWWRKRDPSVVYGGDA